MTAPGPWQQGPGRCRNHPTDKTTSMQEIKLQLAIEEVNLILEGLGNLPFAKVYALVGRIQSQAQQQLEAARSDAPDGVAAGAPLRN